MVLSPDGMLWPCPGPEKTVTLWDLATGQTRATFAIKTKVSDVAFSPDGKTLATWQRWQGDPNVKLWDVATQHAGATLSGAGEGSIVSVAFSPDCRILVAGTQFGSFNVWDIATGQEKLVVRLNGGSGAGRLGGVLPGRQRVGHRGRPRNGRALARRRLAVAGFAQGPYRHNPHPGVCSRWQDAGDGE